jgi:vacuolar-type H+-ATPase subunit I/STV1
MPGDTRISLLAFYQQFVEKEKAIYSELNKFKRENSFVIAVCWSPLNKPDFLETFYGDETNLISETSARRFRVQVEEISFNKIHPPTHFITNDFTAVS